MLNFIEELRDRLSGELPGEDVQFRMAPMARARIKEALHNAQNPKHSAVLACFVPKAGEWNLVLMRRPDYDGTHSGQVSFPGGKLENGEDYQKAALREFQEETGVPVDAEMLLGKLSQLYIPPSNFIVQPFVGFREGHPSYDPDPTEVAQIIELPVSMLLNNDIEVNRKITLSSGIKLATPCFDVNGHIIWGATAMMLSELKEVVKSL